MASIWSEMVPYDRIVDRQVLHELAARDIRLLVAVTPPTLSGAARLVAACRDAGVAIGLWPMIDDCDGRWASEANAAPFRDFTHRLVRSLREAGAMPDEIAVDLEPPIQRVRGMLRGDPRAVLEMPPRTPVLGDLVRALQGEGLRVSAAVTLVAALPWQRASQGWQSLLGTPVERLGLDVVNTMAYTTLIEGYTRGLLRRTDARAVLGALSQVAADRWGPRAAISLGAVGIGALGDERTYRNPHELAEDAAIARGAGVGELSLFCLDGVLARPPIADWLDALCGHDVAPAPKLTPRALALLAGAAAVGFAARLATFDDPR